MRNSTAHSLAAHENLIRLACNQTGQSSAELRQRTNRLANLQRKKRLEKTHLNPEDRQVLDFAIAQNLTPTQLTYSFDCAGLTEELKALLRTNRITISHARRLNGIQNLEGRGLETQRILAQKASQTRHRVAPQSPGPTSRPLGPITV